MTFPTLEQQVSDSWLGGGGEGGVARALTFTSAFLMDAGKIRNLQEDYSLYVNPSYAQMALDGALLKESRKGVTGAM